MIMLRYTYAYILIYYKKNVQPQNHLYESTYLNLFMSAPHTCTEYAWKSKYLN